MAYTVVTKEGNNKLYIIAYRNLPIFEIGVTVPDFPYYLQYVDNKQQLFDTSIKPPKLIKIENIIEEEKIKAISDTITIIHQIISEI